MPESIRKTGKGQFFFGTAVIDGPTAFDLPVVISLRREDPPGMNGIEGKGFSPHSILLVFPVRPEQAFRFEITAAADHHAVGENCRNGRRN